MSEFWVRKIRTYFRKLDVNNDGFISKRDFEEMGDRVADAENTSPEQKAQTKDDFVKVWRLFMKSAGSDDNGLLTESILVASLDQQRNDPEFKETYVRAVHHFFGCLDVNGDGYLSEEEYARSFTEAGVQDTSFVHAAFEYMDLNKHGKLNFAEYTSGVLQHITTEDEHLLFGPLV